MHAPCFVVGIGASAGGQEPLEHIFTTVPADCDISFVVVMHIPPDGPPFLADLIRRYTSMEVLTAEEGMPLRPNTAHVIPPGVTLTMKDGRLRLNQGIAPARTHHPIDSFFTSLAADCGNRAIAVVLSGFGLDGSEGVKRVKEAGGTVIVQDPATAINPPMPQNAIATGAVDMVLPTDDIPGRIADIAHGHCSLLPEACKTATLDEELQAIFAQIKARTGHDFSSYKRNTVLRRIERRMTVNEAGGLRKYLAILEENPQEAQALSQEILIGVTSFFRDPGAFELIRSEIIPSLFAGRDPDDPVRIWHACCATGEEAYSVAMLIHEYLEKEGLQVKTQIFATDIDEGAVAQARSGLYPADIGPEVGEERLKSFFTRSDGRWQVSKQLREKIVFAHHSIIKDPPFSRLDLLVCRNFLIYLDPDMQKRLISLFHMVLKPGGFLFLGASETVGHNSELFATMDKKWKIFRRLDSGRRDDTFFPITSPVRKLAKYAQPKRTAEAGEPAPWTVAERLLVERYSPPCVVVNEKYEAIHVSTRTGRYLEVPTGEPTRDILQMAREDLRPALRAAIYKSFAEHKQVSFRGVKVGFDDGKATVNVLVEPLDADPVYGKLAMVILEPAPSPAAPHLSPGGEALPGDDASKDMLIRQLEDQLRITHEQLHATSEQLETSNESFLSANEELMSINEEFQSTNEELQSTNEELETSKEELQALNEELVTVNSELQGKVEELNQINSDMENLFASSEIAAIFLNRALIIKRFSPAMAAIFNLIPADMGRPFRHLAGTIDWSDLPGDAQAVLETLVPVEREVTALEDGRCYLLRVLPYRTTAGAIDGIVVTLIDITERKRMEEQVRNVALFPEQNPAPVLRAERDGILIYANRAASPLLAQWGCSVGGKLPESVRREVAAALESAVNRELETRCGESDISFMLVPIVARGYVNFYGRDTTGRNLAEEDLRRAKEEWERTFDSVPDLITILDNRHRVLRVNEAMAKRLGLKPEECVGLHCYEAVHGTSGPPEFCPHLRTIEDGSEHVEELHVDCLGGDFLVTTTPLLDEDGKSIGSVHIAHDITERKRMEDALREREIRYRELVQNANSAIIRWRRDGTVTFFNEFAQRFFGYGLEEVLGKNVGMLIPDKESTGGDLTGLLSDIVEHPERHENNVHENVLRDGRRVWMAWTNRPILDEQGEVAEILAVGIDVTERKRAEEIALENEQRLRMAMMVACGGAWDWNLTSGEAWWSPEMYDAWGVEPGTQMLLENSLALVHEDDRDLMRRVVEDSIARCADFNCEFRICHPARGERWMASLGRVVCDDASKPVHLIGITLDVTERKRVEDALRESEERLRLFIEHAPAGLAMFDRNMRYIQASRRWRDDYRLGDRELSGASHYDLFPEIDEEWKEAHSRGLAGEVLRSDADRFMRGDGSVQWVRWEIRPWYDLAGTIGGIVIFAEDITESKQAEKALLESESFYSQTLESIPGMVFTTRPDGYCDYQSSQWEEFTGVPMTEHLGDGWNRLLHPDDRPRAFAAWRAAVEGRAPYDLEYRVRRYDGEYEWFKVIGRPIRDGAGKIVKWFGVAVNIEEIKRGEEELKIAKEAADAANRAKSLFLANMSHELRTPMTGVLGMLEIARSGPLDEKQRDAIETAHKSGKTLLMIINDILDLTRVESGRLVIEDKPFNLHACVAGTVDVLMPEAQRKGIELVWAVDDGVPEYVTGDQVRLIQVLTNLIGNSLKFTERGKVDVRVTAGNETPEAKREITFKVVDSGIGIPNDKSELIFGSFTQADITHTRQYGGTGLGLAICKQIVELMGGTIGCESRLGEGSSFTFTVPLVLAKPEQGESPEPVAETERVSPLAPAQSERKRLLVAEDDEVTRKVLGFMLQKSEFDYEFAEDGLQVVEMWERGGYDLIVMDGQMPGMDGFAATAAIREREREQGGHIPIVAMTAHALKEDRERCLSVGMDAYVSKPIDFKDCMDVIRGALCKSGDDGRER